MLYITVKDRSLTQEFWEMMGNLWTGTYVLQNPTDTAVDALTWLPGVEVQAA